MNPDLLLYFVVWFVAIVDALFGWVWRWLA